MRPQSSSRTTRPSLTRWTCSLPTLLLSSILVSSAAQAHHSWGAIYNGGEPVNVTAIISGEPYRNPHDTVDVAIFNENGEREEWKVEWRGERRGARGMARGQAVQYDLHPGDEVQIDGRTARDPDRKTIQMTLLTRTSDGMIIQARKGRNRGR